MKRFRAIWFCAGAILAAPAIAQAAATCPYASSGLADGCSGANQKGAFHITAAQFASGGYGALSSGLGWNGALQTGQTWPNAHPWSWDAPGIDYPIGYDTSIKLQDPATATVGTGVGQLPPACSYIPNPNFPSTGGMRVYCGGTSATIVIQGLDFSLHGCVPLQFASNFSGDAIVRNNKFENGKNCSIVNGSMVNVAWATNFIFRNNVVIGHGSLFPAGMTLILDNSTIGTATNEYNYYRGVPNRAFTANRPQVINQFNYVFGLNWAPATGLHGEIGIAPNRPNTKYINSYNVIVFDTRSQLNTVPFFLSNSAGFATAQVDHNIIVTNMAGFVGSASAAGGQATTKNPQGGASASSSWISGNTLTVGALTSGVIAPGQRVTGPGVITPTQIVRGGANGKWIIDRSQNVAPAALAFTPVASVSALFAEMTAGSFGTVTVTNNYGDPTGSLLCTYQLPGANIASLTLSGNVSLLTGHPMNTVNAVYPTAACD